MKKTVSLLLCMILILAVFAGCGEEAAPETTAPTEPSMPPVIEVAFETQPDGRKYQGVQLQYLSMLEEKDPRAVAVTQAAEVFEKRTGAQVAVTWLGGNGELLAQILAEGTGVDIFETSGSDLQNIFLGDALDLTEMAQAADYESRSYAALRRQVTDRCGYLAGIPCTPYLTAVYYNREAFEACGLTAAPTSWEEFTAACRSLKNAGFGPLAMDAEFARVPLELHLERSLGAERLAALLADGGWEEDLQAMYAVQQITEFVDGGFLAAGSPAAYPAGRNLIGLSNAVMVAASNTDCREVAKAASADLRWGVFAWPGGDAGTGTAVDADVLAVYRDSANAQAAFDFIMLLVTGEFDQLRADLGYGIPADPANVPLITGAAETLAAAAPRSLGLLGEADNEQVLKLWQGKYKIKASVG